MGLCFSFIPAASLIFSASTQSGKNKSFSKPLFFPPGVPSQGPLAPPWILRSPTQLLAAIRSRRNTSENPFCPRQRRRLAVASFRAGGRHAPRPKALSARSGPLAPSPLDPNAPKNQILCFFDNRTPALPKEPQKKWRLVP